MNKAIEQLTGLRVEQLMARDVVTVQAESGMAEAAELLRTYRISGVPVVDATGRCVGVLSTTDFVEDSSAVSKMRGEGKVARTAAPGTNGKAQPRELVRNHMSDKVHSVCEYLSAVDAGKLMCQEHIHRLVVVDRHGRPVGVLSSLDLVSALVSASQTNS